MTQKEVEQYDLQELKDSIAKIRSADDRATDAIRRKDRDSVEVAVEDIRAAIRMVGTKWRIVEKLIKADGV